MNEKIQTQLESLNYMGLLIMVFCLSFSFSGTNFAGQSGYFYWLFSDVLLLSICLVLVHYKIGRVVSFWVAVGWLSLLVIVGFAYSNKHQITVCYMPLLVEGAMLGIGMLLVYFRAPERWCTDNRFA